MNSQEQFEYANNYVRKNLCSLNNEQLNWKPSADKWSIAQCIHHLIVNNTKYFKTFDAIINNNYSQTFWQRTSPFTKWLGKKLLQFTAAEPHKKAKAPRMFSPSSSNIADDIIQKFLEQQDVLLGYFNKLEPFAAANKIIVSSPLSGIVTFDLKTLLTAFGQHEIRHINQADAVLHHPQFPKA